MTKERNKFGILHYCFLHKFKDRCSNLSCLILSCGVGLIKKKKGRKRKISKLTILIFFLLYLSASRHSLNQIPNKERRLGACLFAETAGNLFDFWGATEGVRASADRRHRQADLVLLVMWAHLQFSSPFKRLEIGCWNSAKGVWGMLSQRVWALLSPLWEKTGWPCIIFYSCICTGGEITVSSWNGRHNDIRVWGHL